MIIISAIILCSIFIILFISYLIYYFEQDKGIKLSFNEFYKYYCLNPDSWVLGDSFLIKKCGYPKFDSYNCRIKFTSYWRYLIFLYMKNKNIKLKKHNEEYINFLEAIQLDIDKCREAANKYNKQGVDIINKIINNYNKK